MVYHGVVGKAKNFQIEPGHPDHDIDEKVRRRYRNDCQYQLEGLRCGRPHYAKGLCQAHYTRKARYGSPGSVYVGPPPARKLEGWMVIMAQQKIAAGEWCLQDAANYFDLSKVSMSEAVNGITFKALTTPGE